MDAIETMGQVKGGDEPQDDGIRDALERAADANGLEADYWDQPRQSYQEGEQAKEGEQAHDPSLRESLQGNLDQRSGDSEPAQTVSYGRRSFDQDPAPIINQHFDQLRDQALAAGNNEYAAAVELVRGGTLAGLVDNFAAAKDAKGNPLHPHFDVVAKDVAGLIRAAREEGKNLSLKRAYEMAVEQNPSLKAKTEKAPRRERDPSLRESLERRAGNWGE